MNVVPALTADRAESVLHDIAMARVRSGSGSPAATPAAEAPSLVAEHEANDLLNKGDQAKAAAKFVESEKLRDKESGRAAIGQALATAAPSVDASIQKSSGAESATEPLPAAPGAAGSPTPDKPAAPAPDSQPRPEPPAQGDALAAPGAAGSPTPAQAAAPAPDSQPKPEPPGQGHAPVALAPGAAGSPTPAQAAAPALDSQPKPEPPGQGDAPGAGTRRGWIAHPCSACRSCSRQPAQAGTAWPGRCARRWHPARLDRPPLLSLPLLLPTASPSLNRLARAMRPGAGTRRGWFADPCSGCRSCSRQPAQAGTAWPGRCARRWRPARLVRRPLLRLPLLPSTASPSRNRLARAMRPALAPGAAGSPTPAQAAAPALDSQPKPEPPGQGDAPGALAPGAAGSPTPAQPAAPAPDSQPKPEPPGQGDAPGALVPGAAGSPTPAQPAAPAPDSQPKPEPPGQGDAPGAGARRGWFADPCSACRSCPRQPAQA